MREFDYQAPRSLSEALAILAQSNGNARATGVRVCDMPMTPERVFWALKEASKAKGKGTQAAG